MGLTNDCLIRTGKISLRFIWTPDSHSKSIWVQSYFAPNIQQCMMFVHPCLCVFMCFLWSTLSSAFPLNPPVRCVTDPTLLVCLSRSPSKARTAMSRREGLSGGGRAAERRGGERSDLRAFTLPRHAGEQNRWESLAKAVMLSAHGAPRCNLCLMWCAGSMIWVLMRPPLTASLQHYNREGSLLIWSGREGNMIAHFSI